MSSCTPCQFALNLALALDKLVNTVLLGDPNETLSRRIGRAAVVGSRPATLVCWVLGLIRPNHCAKAQTPGTQGRELWHWSNNDTEPVL